MSKRLLLPRSQVTGLDGRPISGAKLYTYATGTSTPKAVFTDAGLTVAHANPVIADSAGRFPAMFLGSGDYRTILTDAADVVIATDDPVEGNTAETATDIAVAVAAARRNRLLNPAHQIGQERGTANLDVTDVGSPYIADGWQATLSATPGGTLRCARVAVASPAGSTHRLRMTVQATDATISSGDFYFIESRVEGVQFADALFGTSSARTVFLRFGVRSSVAGTFGVALRNGAGNRSWVGTFNIGSGDVNRDVVRSFAIPGDTAGTWATDNTIGVSLRITLAAGATFQGVSGWQAGTFLTLAGQTNLMATGSATLELFDCGLYVDVAGAGVAPPFEVPDLSEELRRCQRYYAKTFNQATAPAQNAGLAGALFAVSYAAGGLGATWQFPVEMRVAPALTSYNPSATNANWRDTTNSTDRTAIAASAIGTTAADIRASDSASGAAWNYVHLTADARL